MTREARAAAGFAAFPRAWRFVSATAAAFALALAASGCAAKELERSGGPYVPTPQIVVDHMLRLGKVGPDDYLVDLGSGDGVIVLTAARRYKARGFGVDIDSDLVARSNAEAKRLGIADRVSFRVLDVFKTDVSRASVITLYLLPSMMIELRAKLFAEARPGTRIVSHDYSFDDWLADEYVQLDVPEKEPINGSPTATLHLWIIPAKVAGRWRVQAEGEHYDLDLRQSYQMLRGSATSGPQTLRVSSGRLRGEDVRFTLARDGVRREFTGRVTSEGMQGTVDLGNSKIVRWTAKKR